MSFHKYLKEEPSVPPLLDFEEIEEVDDEDEYDEDDDDECEEDDDDEEGSDNDIDDSSSEFKVGDVVKLLGIYGVVEPIPYTIEAGSWDSDGNLRFWKLRNEQGDLKIRNSCDIAPIRIDNYA